MNKWICLVLGVLLISLTSIRCEEDSEEDTAEEYEYEEVEEDVEEGSDSDGADKDDDEADGSDAPEIVEDDDVMVLNSANFDYVVKNNEIVLVEFYAPWCGHCKTLAPEYAKAAKVLKNDKYPVQLGKVDATEEKDLGSRFSVSGYPTLKVFKNGEAVDYEGPREELGIIEYMRERADPNWKPPPAAVVTLTVDDFDDFINEHDLSLVEFYAPWCGHCKKLEPEYEKAAKLLNQLDPPVKLAKVDSTVEKELGERFDVSGFPTLKMFRNGKVFEYGGGRDTHTIVDYMKKQVGLASKEVKSLKELKNRMLKEDVTVVGFFNSKDDQSYSLYQDAVNDLREEYTLLHTFDKEARTSYKMNPGSVVVFNAERFYTKFESKWHLLEINEKSELSDISGHIKDHSVPLVGHYNDQTKSKRYTDKRPLVLVFFTVDFGFDGIKATQIWRNKVADIAKNKKYASLTFAVADDEKNAQEFSGFGFDDSGEDVNIGILGEKDIKYPMPPMDEFDEDEILEFLDKFMKGKIKPKMKSQAVPKKQKGPVTVVVGKNFEEVVLDKKKDVLIEFYAPWCGHCKTLEPIYKDLAKKHKKDKNLVIAKMDATANDFPPQFEAKGFPTIYFAPSNNKDSPIKFEGGNRDIEGFNKFMSEHATVSLGKTVGKEEL